MKIKLLAKISLLCSNKAKKQKCYILVRQKPNIYVSAKGIMQHFPKQKKKKKQPCTQVLCFF